MILQDLRSWSCKRNLEVDDTPRLTLMELHRQSLCSTIICRAVKGQTLIYNYYY